MVVILLILIGRLVSFLDASLHYPLFVLIVFYSCNHRTDSMGEVAKQEQHVPILLPKLPGRYYYFLGKPIETEGTSQTHALTVKSIQFASFFWAFR